MIPKIIEMPRTIPPQFSSQTIPSKWDPKLHEGPYFDAHGVDVKASHTEFKLYPKRLGKDGMTWSPGPQVPMNTAAITTPVGGLETADAAEILEEGNSTADDPESAVFDDEARKFVAEMGFNVGEVEQRIGKMTGVQLHVSLLFLQEKKKALLRAATAGRLPIPVQRVPRDWMEEGITPEVLIARTREILKVEQKRLEEERAQKRKDMERANEKLIAVYNERLEQKRQLDERLRKQKEEEKETARKNRDIEEKRILAQYRADLERKKQEEERLRKERDMEQQWEKALRDDARRKAATMELAMERQKVDARKEQELGQKREEEKQAWRRIEAEREEAKREREMLFARGNQYRNQKREDEERAQIRRNIEKKAKDRQAEIMKAEVIASARERQIQIKEREREKQAQVQVTKNMEKEETIRKLQERQRAIVQAGIDSAHQPLSKKRPHDDSEDDFQGTSGSNAKIPKTKNAFSAMMSASKQSRAKHTLNPIHFGGEGGWKASFEASLEHAEIYMFNTTRAALITKVMMQSLAQMVQPHLNHSLAHIETKINALHLFIEIACGIAYAPQDDTSNAVRNGAVPNYLVHQIYNLVKSMSRAEIRQVREEAAFMSKVKDLRQNPSVPYEGDIWNGLDDVLRILGDNGPVDFKRCFTEFRDVILDRRVSGIAKGAIIKVIRDDILGVVHQDCCFATKYNAIDAILELLMLLLVDKYSSMPTTEKAITSEALGALGKIGRMFTDEETSKVLDELKLEPGTPASTFLDDFQSEMEPLYVKDYSTWVYDPNPGKPRLEAFLQQRFHNPPAQGKKGLLVKILYARWDMCESEKCKAFWDDLDDIVELFIEKSTPVRNKRYLDRIARTLGRHMSLYSGYIEEDMASTRTCIDRTIGRLSIRAGGTASSDVKISVLITLTKIGLQILEFLAGDQIYRKRVLFQDHITEDVLTDAMATVCHSLVKSKSTEALSNQDFLKGLKEFDTRREELPEAFEGLDAVLDLINNPCFTTHASKRAKAVKVVPVIDLTDD